MRINRFSKNSAVITLSRPSVLLHPAHIATLHAEYSAVITKVKHKVLKCQCRRMPCSYTPHGEKINATGKESHNGRQRWEKR